MTLIFLGSTTQTKMIGGRIEGNWVPLDQYLGVTSRSEYRTYMPSHTDPSILLFDGVCNLCNRAVQFVIRHDTKGKFHFASLQSEAGQAILRRWNLPTETFDSFVLVEGGKLYTRSTAALRVARQLPGGWKLVYGLVIVPAFIRDGVYDWIARNRYRFFGRRETCLIPSPELKARFLE